MKIIISPAKTMRDNEDGFAIEAEPLFKKEAKQLLEELKKFDVEGLMKLMKCNRKLAELNYERFKRMDLDCPSVPALFAYDGLQYKSMAPHVFSADEYTYIKEHLIIFSGFYGLLRPYDGVSFYRLEMQTELSGPGWTNLYDFWKDKLYSQLFCGHETVVDLASKEYSQVIRPYLSDTDQMVECVFGFLDQNKVKVKGTLAKMARGAMVRYMAENQVETIDQLKLFQGLDFHFCKELSKPHQLVFLKTTQEHAGDF